MTGAVALTAGTMGAFTAATGPAAGLLFVAEGGAAVFAAEVAVGAGVAAASAAKSIDKAHRFVEKWASDAYK